MCYDQGMEKRRGNPGRSILRLDILAHPGSVFALIAMLAICPGSTGLKASPGKPFVKGADISFLQQIEDNGGVYTEDGVPRDALDIFKDHGFNYFRLRLWHTPSGGYCNLEKTLLMAQRIKQRDLGFLLDFHYSDTWADPGKQYKPASWTGISYDALKDSVYAYTRHVIEELKAQNTLPDMVQIGNEIICGMLWDDGRVCGAWNTPEQWQQFAGLVKEGIRGVEDATDAGDSVRIVIHIDRGGDTGGSIWFFDHLLAEGVDFDVIGQSFYPWWHGTLGDLEANLDTLAKRYGKDIVIAETAYPWTLGWYDDTHNIVGLPEHLHEGYPASVEGQKAFLLDLMEIVAGVPDCRGAGVFYWAPDWISAPGLGSPWENVTLFSFEGEALSSMAAFDSAMAGVGPGKPPDSPEPPVRLNQNFPNPFGGQTSISYDLSEDTHVVLKIYDLLGKETRTLVDGPCSAGPNAVHWDGTGDDGDMAAPGIYLCRLSSDRRSEATKIILLR